MNSFAKFQAQLQAKAGTSRSADSVTKVIVPKATEKHEIVERILTVNIKTMRKHMRDEKNFNNAQTLLEVFAKINRISPLPVDSQMRSYKLTIENLENTLPCHKMEADYFGNAIRTIQSDDDVRCVGRLNGQTGRFRIMHISKIDVDDEITLIKRLEAISNFEITKFK